MKRILITLSAFLAISVLPLSLNAQEAKTEKKIKIIIDDGSGKKTIIDTLVTGDSDIETLSLDGGRVILVSDPEIRHDHNGQKNITVTVTSDDENGKNLKEVKEISIISSDSADLEKNEDGKKVYVYTVDTDNQHHHGNGNVTVLTSEEGKGNGHKVIVVKEAHGGEFSKEKDGDVFVSKDREDSSAEKTRFVVARDGMVVTVEGEDEAKAREMMKVIEDHLGVKSKDEVKPVKTETKKGSKK